jgi:pimeloyl-ACP methyl ester carboxylesterase
MKKSIMRLALALALFTIVVGTARLLAYGEAGPLRLAQYGYFMVNTKITPDNNVTEQMFVEFMIPQQQRYQYPVVLVHGGGGQGTDWMSTVDGRDGWVNYFVNAGFAVYWIDRPGSARSISNSTYGRGMLAGPRPANGPIGNATSKNWPGAPMIYKADGTPDIEGWRTKNASNPMIAAWGATSPTTPFASNEISVAAQAALLEKIGPAIVLTHSAGGTTAAGASLVAAAKGKLIGLLAFESGGANPYGNVILEGAKWSNGAPGDSARAERKIATGMCSLQTAQQKSQNLTFDNVRVAYLYSNRIQDENVLNTVSCLAEQSREAGVETIGVWMPEHRGGEGTGHFVMSELVNGDVAKNIVVPMLAWLEGQALPRGFKTH